VTIFDANEKAGGMLRYGIPEYRLPYDQVEKDIAFIESLGVVFRQDMQIGVDVEFNEIYDTHDAIFFSTGLSDPYALDIAGEDLPGVMSPLQMLADVTDGKQPAIGSSVVVVGGGNVAMDAARTSRRYGAQVTVLYRRREVDMPADVEEIHEARGEGCDIIVQAIPLRIEKGDDTRLKLYWGEAEMVSDGPGKRPRPVLIEGSERVIACDTVIPAIGQAGNFSFLPEGMASQLLGPKGSVVVDEYHRTAVPKMYAGGDIANPKRDAISAIANGHSAAKGIDIFLNNCAD
jgi:glutamate synthase (NADPH/NADH) small chain